MNQLNEYTFEFTGTIKLLATSEDHGLKQVHDALNSPIYMICQK